jgi:hypothetical protein
VEYSDPCSDPGDVHPGPSPPSSESVLPLVTLCDGGDGGGVGGGGDGDGGEHEVDLFDWHLLHTYFCSSGKESILTPAHP